MSVPQLTEKQYTKVINGCREIFVKKTRDYGPSWKVLRMASITDQIFIKAERIKTIEQGNENKVGESVEGEFMGIINYCAIALILWEIEQHDGVFPENFEDADTLERKYDEKIKDAFDTMAKKNHDYGEVWRKMRVTSFTDLILMKILRLKQIEDNEGSTLISEGPDANYIDILNYSVFALIKLGE